MNGKTALGVIKTTLDVMEITSALCIRAPPNEPGATGS